MAEAEDRETTSTLTAEQIAKLCDRHVGWVYELRKRGHLPKGHQKTNVVHVVRGVMSYYEELQQKSARKEAAMSATRARTEEINFRLAQRRKELIHAEDARATFIDLVSMVVAEMASIPAAFTRDLDERQRLEEIINGARERLSSECEAKSTALLGSGEPPETKPAKKPRRVGKSKSSVSRKRGDAGGA